MLHQAYLLEIDAAQTLGVRQLPQRSWWPVLVVPRALCVFEALPCRGLPWRERGQFARTQAQRLAPFADCGFNASVRGDTLMLWFWDQAEVRQAAQTRQLNPQRTRVWAEPLLRSVPAGSGDRLIACQGGVDVQTLAQGAIVASRWQPGNTVATSAPTTALRTWPWAWELADQKLVAPDAALAASARSAWSWPSVARWVSVACLVGTASFAAYWGTQVLGARDQLQKLQNEADSSSKRLGDLASLRSQSSNASDWLKRYEQLALGLQWPELVDSLAPVFERHGVVMKEMEAKEDEVKLVLASAGSDIDLPALLKALKTTPGLSNVQLRAGLDFSQATFSLRATGFMRAAALPPKKGLPNGG
jgi:hypothetical protein